MSKLNKAIAALGIVAGLGVAALPLSSYADQVGPNYGGTSVPATAEATVSAIVIDSISLTLDKDDLTLSGVNATAPVEGKISATVETNAGGYTLKLKAKTGDDINMVGSGTADGKTIPAVTNNNVATLPTGTSAYGFKVAGYNSGNYQALTEVDQTIVSKEESLTSAETTDVTFGVAVSATQAAGSYASHVVFTATVNNG